MSPDQMYLVRNQRSDKVHRSTCRYARMPGSHRWRWADAYPDVNWARDYPWNKQCQVCMPPSPLHEPGGRR